ncbi:hypothetical protein ACQU0X_31230 [Pseudovibrio ascidiaceicola]|uniref:DNA polymerase III subunit beta family protein n=1 Tax=Pseudovibrio ascidiaceicola TaxID=285279 RepID=UPI003D3631BF
MDFSIPVPLYMIKAAHELLKTNEEHRYYINCLQVEVKDDAVLLIATNGSIMLVQSIDLDAEIGRGSFTIPRKVLDQLPKATKSNRDELYELSESSAQGPDLSFGWKPEKIDYPNWRRVLPSDGYEKAFAKYDPKYILLFSKIAKTLHAPSCQILPNSEPHPALVTFDGVEQAFGVVMPIKMTEHSTKKPFEIWEQEFQEEAA